MNSYTVVGNSKHGKYAIDLELAPHLNNLDDLISDVIKAINTHMHKAGLDTTTALDLSSVIVNDEHRKYMGSYQIVKQSKTLAFVEIVNAESDDSRTSISCYVARCTQCRMYAEDHANELIEELEDKIKSCNLYLASFDDAEESTVTQEVQRDVTELMINIEVIQYMISEYGICPMTDEEVFANEYILDAVEDYFEDKGKLITIQSAWKVTFNRFVEPKDLNAEVNNMINNAFSVQDKL